MDIVIQNIPISFPVKPYGCQLSLMNRVIESLECSKNCFLESPTGTGKTLALLCASLGWLSTKIVNEETLQPACERCQIKSPVKDSKFEKSDGPLCECSTSGKQSGFQVPKIYYCTRTHKQISQVVRELRRTKYRFAKMTILSSRQHSCINPVIKREPNVTEACRNLLTKGYCEYDQPRSKSDLIRNLNRLDSRGAWDLEDFVSVLAELPSCPYFCARKLVKTASIIFCPYNYLLDPINRSAVDLDLKGHVVILDEAHNIEDASREAASFKITEYQLLNAKEDMIKMISRGFEPDSCTKLITMIDALLRVMQLTRSRLVRAGEVTEPTHVWTSQEIAGLMSAVELGPGKLTEMQVAHRCLVASTLENNDRTDRVTSDSDQPRPTASSMHMFAALFTALRYMLGNDQRNLANYRVVLTETVEFERQPSVVNSEGSRLWLSKQSSKSRLIESRELSLNFWCLNPSVVFSELATEVRCLILASGTLSPMNAMEAELGVPFPIRLQANHVIPKDRLLVGVLSHGPGGNRLCGTYQQQNTYSFQDEVGQLVLQASYLVPGGILCFVSSYGLLDKLVQRWETTGLLSDLQRIKHVMFEPRSSVGLASWLDEFYRAVDNHRPAALIFPSATCSQNVNVNGALALAVCRGKVSEGLDFADAYGRLVITVGIPYPAFQNPLVQQKREFNDTTRRLSGDSVLRSAGRPDTAAFLVSDSSPNASVTESSSLRAGDSQTKCLLSGSEWYDAQAYKALNQCLGRCIRHMNDWGATLLVDSRFVEQPSRYMSGISRWIQCRATRYTDWPSFASRLRDFINSHHICTKVDQEKDELADIFAD